MSFTTFANGFSVATKGTAHMARSTAPDVCKLANGTPTPFPNYIMTTELGTGMTTKTMVQGNPIWTAAGILDATPSLPAHAGVNGGSKGQYQGPAAPTQWSSDVLVEGNGVVCMTYTTTQNDKNTVGVVDNAANLANLLAELDAAATDAAAADTTGDAGNPDEGDAPDETEGEDADHGEDDGSDSASTDEETKCKLSGASIQCEHNGRSVDSGLLEVVPADGGSDRITLTATMDPEADGADCSAEHPVWNVTGMEQTTFKGDAAKSAELQVTCRAQNAVSAMNPLFLVAVPPASYNLSVEACGGDSKTYNVLVYPGIVHSIKLSGSSPSLNAVPLALGGLGRFLNRTLGAVIEFHFLEGSLELSLCWKEHTDHTAYPELKLTGSFDPLIGVNAKVPIPWGPLEGVHKAIQKGLKAINPGARAEIDFILKGSIGISISVEHTWRVALKRKYKGEAKATLAAGIGIEVTLDPDMLSVTAEITGAVSVSFSVESGNPVNGKVAANVGRIAGSVEVKAILGTIPWTDYEIGFTYKREVVFFDGYDLPIAEFPILSMNA